MADGLATVSRDDLAWAAGVFEGEGSTTARRMTPGSCHLQVKILMTDEDVLQRVCRITGLGKVYGPYKRKNKSWKPYWVWIAYSNEGYAAVVALFPWLLSRRREQVRRAIMRWLEAFHARRTPSARFWDLVDQRADCWLWTGALASNVRNGERIYGQFALRHEHTVLAHRFAFAESNGDLERFEQLYSSCGTPLCVRPDHWYSTKQCCKYGHDRSVHGATRDKGRWRCTECLRISRAGRTLQGGRHGR